MAVLSPIDPALTQVSASKRKAIHLLLLGDQRKARADGKYLHSNQQCSFRKSKQQIVSRRYYRISRLFKVVANHLPLALPHCNLAFSGQLSAPAKQNILLQPQEVAQLSANVDYAHPQLIQLQTVPKVPFADVEQIWAATSA